MPESGAPAEVPSKLKRAIVLLPSLVTQTCEPKTPMPTGLRRLAVSLVPATPPVVVKRETEFPSLLATHTCEPTTARSNGVLKLLPEMAPPAELPSELNREIVLVPVLETQIWLPTRPIPAGELRPLPDSGACAGAQNWTAREPPRPVGGGESAPDAGRGRITANMQRRASAGSR